MLVFVYSSRIHKVLNNIVLTEEPTLFSESWREPGWILFGGGFKKNFSLPVIKPHLGGKA